MPIDSQLALARDAIAGLCRRINLASLATSLLPLMTQRHLVLLLASVASAFTSAAAQRADSISAPVTGMHYAVSVTREAMMARQLGVVTTFEVAGTGTVLLSLPEWTPGAYEVGNFARWVNGFSAEENGAPLRWDKADKDTWRIRPTKAGRVTVSFHFLADTLDNAISWTKPDVALFNGTNLFMYPQGRSLDFASTVSITADADAKIATSMAAGSAPRTYRAGGYHELVDMPFLVGQFDMDSATISGKTVRYATYPAGSVTRDARATAWSQLKRIIPVESTVFGETPWDSYTLIQITDSSSQGYSGLEHSASHVDIVAPQFAGSESQPSLFAHEIFHAWNVKRLRPADMVPYAYDREQPTPWLWVSEGITDYYADLTESRAGLVDPGGFYALTGAKIGEIAATVPFALEDASINTWMHPKDGTEYSYYPKGSLAGFMLDIMIRDASDNKRSLDLVMRELYASTYKKGRGFTHDDFWGAVSRAANGKSFAEFERMYVDGREPYPWGTLLPVIGLRMAADSATRIGVTTGVDPAGMVRVLQVDPGSSAALAGVKPGDELVSVGDIAVSDQDFGAKFRLRYQGRPSGSALPLVVKRGTETVTLRGMLRYAPSAPRLAEDPAASARAVRLRNGILQGVTDR